MSKSRLEAQISDAKYAAGTEIERTSKVFTRAQIPDGPPALHILDVGCGTGLNARHLMVKGHKVTGIDISPVAIEKFVAAGLDGRVCDISERLPFDDGSFDLVFASEVIEHLADTDAFLSELNRVLKPGGMLVLSTPNSSFWAFRLLAVLGQSATDAQHPGHVRFFSRRGLTRHLKATGFKQIQIAGRHMWLIIGQPMGSLLGWLLAPLGFREEMRFKTKTTFWQLSGFAPKASTLWADTFIVTAHKNA